MVSNVWMACIYSTIIINSGIQKSFHKNYLINFCRIILYSAGKPVTHFDNNNQIFKALSSSTSFSGIIEGCSAGTSLRHKYDSLQQSLQTHNLSLIALPPYYWTIFLGKNCVLGLIYENYGRSCLGNWPLEFRKINRSISGAYQIKLLNTEICYNFPSQPSVVLPA